MERIFDPLPGWEACAGDARAAILDQGAHVVAWQPAGEEPVLWLSPTARLEPGAAIRGGVPICFPWFGAGPAGTCTPSHGFARNVTWQVLSQEDSDDGARLEYLLTPAIAGRADTSGLPYEARFVVGFGAHELSLELSITNTGEQPIALEAALHTYLAVGDVRRVRLVGLDAAEYVDKVGGGLQRQTGAVTFAGPTDRIYRSATDIELHDPVFQRLLLVRKQGSRNTVVWNPWSDGAATMDDVPDDGWPGFVCVEAASVGDDCLHLTPGETHVLAQRVSVLREGAEP